MPLVESRTGNIGIFLRYFFVIGITARVDPKYIFVGIQCHPTLAETFCIYVIFNVVKNDETRKR